MKKNYNALSTKTTLKTKLKNTFFAITGFCFMSSTSNAQVGAALNLDGSNDYISCGNILTASYSKEAWINLSNAGLNNNVISGGGALGQHAFWAPTGYGNRLSGGHNGAWNQVQDPTPLSLGVWYHIALTYDAPTTTMKLYKNGVLVSTNAAVPVYGGSTGVQIGAYDPGANLFAGNVDEVRIWNTVRTQCQIVTFMNCEIPTSSPGLVANYHFNQGIAGGANPGLTSLTDAGGFFCCSHHTNRTSGRVAFFVSLKKRIETISESQFSIQKFKRGRIFYSN